MDVLATTLTRFGSTFGAVPEPDEPDQDEHDLTHGDWSRPDCARCVAREIDEQLDRPETRGRDRTHQGG